MKVVQLVHTLTPGDAISGEAVLIKKLLDGLKISNTIFASAVHRDYLVKGIAKGLPIDCESDFLFFHYSIGGLLSHFLKASSKVKVLFFHNLTPLSFFEIYNSAIVKNLEEGLANLKVAVEISDVVICDSEFNLKELKELTNSDLSNKRVFILRLTAPDTLLQATEAFFSFFPSSFLKSRVKFLTVGRIAPNKNLEKVIEIFACFKRFVEGSSALAIVGTDVDCEIYRAHLELAVKFFDVEDSVFFFGSVSDKTLKLLYKIASVYLCTSLHEGFCVPLVEAFSFNLPVIALKNGAIPETLGEAGICFDTQEIEPILKALYLIVNDEQFKTDILLKQRERLKDLSKEKFEENFLAILSQLGIV